MTMEAPPTPEPTRPIPGRIAYVLHVIHTFVAYARHFTATANTRVEVPEFATAARFFGTYDLPVILLRMKRGVLRALALERYLLKRAARGGNLRSFPGNSFTGLQPHHYPPPKPPGPKRAPLTHPRRKDPALAGPDDPRAYYLPTEQELDAWVRRTPIGRSITYICLDLGVAPELCHGDLWMYLYNIVRYYRGSINNLYDVRAVREKTFERERDRRPETWHIDWRDLSLPTVRKALGCLIGEIPPDHGLPVIVPS